MFMTTKASMTWTAMMLAVMNKNVETMAMILFM